MSKKLFKGLVVFIISLALLESLLWFLYQRADTLGKSIFRAVLQDIYFQKRNTAQYEKDCAQYHPTLAYTLKPGSCNFSNKEFSTTLHINSLGLRDDEESLRAPGILVLGDSFAMGWGVNNEDSFAQLIEDGMGIKTLNTAISSYGTSREFINAERIDASKLETIIVQYNWTDMGENREYKKQGNQLPVMSKEKYLSATSFYERNKRDFFGSNIYCLIPKDIPGRLGLRNIFSNSSKKKKPGNPSLSEAELFMNVICSTKLNLQKVSLIVFEMNNYRKMNGKFSGALREILKGSACGSDSPPWKSFQVLDLSQDLKKEHFYPLDTHLNATGHKVTAEVLLKALKSS